MEMASKVFKKCIVIDNARPNWKSFQKVNVLQKCEVGQAGVRTISSVNLPLRITKV